jgi:hypothetical protein
MTVGTSGEKENELAHEVHEFLEDLEAVARTVRNQGGDIDCDDLLHSLKMT